MLFCCVVLQAHQIEFEGVRIGLDAAWAEKGSRLRFWSAFLWCLLQAYQIGFEGVVSFASPPDWVWGCQKWSDAAWAEKGARLRFWSAFL